MSDWKSRPYELPGSHFMWTWTYPNQPHSSGCPAFDHLRLDFLTPKEFQSGWCVISRLVLVKEQRYAWILFQEIPSRQRPTFEKSLVVLLSHVLIRTYVDSTGRGGMCVLCVCDFLLTFSHNGGPFSLSLNPLCLIKDDSTTTWR